MQIVPNKIKSVVGLFKYNKIITTIMIFKKLQNFFASLNCETTIYKNV